MIKSNPKTRARNVLQGWRPNDPTVQSALTRILRTLPNNVEWEGILEKLDDLITVVQTDRAHEAVAYYIREVRASQGSTLPATEEYIDRKLSAFVDYIREFKQLIEKERGDG